MINFYPLEVVGRGSGTELQVGENLPQREKGHPCTAKHDYSVFNRFYWKVKLQ